MKIPGVLAVIDRRTLAKYKLHWMPTISSDTQMVLPTDAVMYQAQEVAAVIATERYIAADGADAVDVEYEPLPLIVDPFKSLAPGAPVLRHDKKDKKDNLAFHWEAGDRADADKAIAAVGSPGRASTSICRASTSRRWRLAAASPTSTPRRASSRST